MKEFLNNLINASSPSGYEFQALEVFGKFCMDNGLEHAFTDSIGNMAFKVGNGKIPFMISGASSVRG